MKPRRIHTTLLSLGLTALMALGACGSGDGSTEEEDDPTPRAVETGPRDINVIGTDYAFGGIPSNIGSGSTLNLRNVSAEEVHEVAVFKLSDEETRPATELFELPEEELLEVLGDRPAVVIVAAPGQEGDVASGSATLTERGRYAFACFVPTGADPDEFLAARDGSGFSGAPHYTEGMFAEARVE